MTACATVSLTVKVAWPLALVVPLTVVIVELPLPAVSETVLPLTGLLFASLSVAVMVEVVEPSAVTEVGLALTVDVLALTVPAARVNVALAFAAPAEHPPVLQTLTVHVPVGPVGAKVSVNVVGGEEGTVSVVSRTRVPEGLIQSMKKFPALPLPFVAVTTTFEQTVCPAVNELAGVVQVDSSIATVAVATPVESVNFTSACMADCAPTALTLKFAPACTSWTMKYGLTTNPPLASAATVL